MPVARSYREYLQMIMQEHWDGASLFARIALWWDGQRPEGARWLA